MKIKDKLLPTEREGIEMYGHRKLIWIVAAFLALPQSAFAA